MTKYTQHGVWWRLAAGQKWVPEMLEFSSKSETWDLKPESKKTPETGIQVQPWCWILWLRQSNSEYNAPKLRNIRNRCNAQALIHGARNNAVPLSKLIIFMRPLTQLNIASKVRLKWWTKINKAVTQPGSYRQRLPRSVPVNPIVNYTCCCLNSATRLSTCGGHEVRTKNARSTWANDDDDDKHEEWSNQQQAFAGSLSLKHCLNTSKEVVFVHRGKTMDFLIINRSGSLWVRAKIANLSCRT